MAGLTDLDVAQKACALVGITPITSFTPDSVGSTDEAEIVLLNELFQVSVEARLEEYPYRWAMKQVRLALESEAPLARWDHAYTEPTDVILPRALTVNDKPIIYDRYEGKFFANTAASDQVYLDYIFRVPTQKWPSQFTMGMIFEMASQLADGVQEDAEKAAQLADRAQVWFIKASTRDSQGQTSKSLPHSRFISQRIGGRIGRVTNNTT